MSTGYNFSKEIASFRKDKKYQEALDYFKINKSDLTAEEIGENEYIVSDMLTCLRHTNNIESGYKFLLSYNIIVNEQTAERVLTAYGWLLYDNYKAINSNSTFEPEHFSLDDTDENIGHDFNFDTSELAKRTEAVITLLMNFTSDFSTTVFEFLFKIVLKTEKKKSRPDWEFVVSFCDRIDPEKLSTKVEIIKIQRKGQEKDMKLASTREEWYANLSKGLFKTANYERCYEISKKALGSFTEFHYGYDIWFARRIALCKKEMGNIQAAIEELEAILKVKREWFIRKELAEMYFEQGEFDKAYSQVMQ